MAQRRPAGVEAADHPEGECDFGLPRVPEREQVLLQDDVRPKQDEIAGLSKPSGRVLAI